jgi:hypothetical protein
MSNFSAIFRLVANAQGFQSTINSAKGAVAGIGGKLGEGLKGQVSRIMSVSNAFTMLKGTMEEVLNRAKQYNNLGLRMGIPAAEVQKLDKAAERAGVNVASLGRGMLLVQKFAGEVIGGATEKAKKFGRELGATPEQLAKMKAGGTEALATLSDLLMKVSDEGQRAIIGQAVLGEKWFELQQLIEGGSDAIRKATEDQTTWNQYTQDSLTRSQRAWANMWNDISVESAEFLADMEPVIGILRMLGNIVMTLIRIPIFLLGMALKALKATALGVAWALASIFGDEDSAKKLGKAFEKTIDEGVAKTDKFFENLEKDEKGFEKGANMLFGLPTGEEVKQKVKGKPSDDTRSLEEKNAYEQALKKQKEQSVATALSNAKEEEKLDLLRKQLDILKEQEEELKKKHPQRYKETAEYLELQKKMAEQERKMALQRRSDEKRLYENQVNFANMSNERRLKRMEAAGATEEEMYRERIRQGKEEAVRLADEYQVLARDKFATDEDRRKKAEELAKSIANTEDLVFAQQKKEKEQDVGPAVTSSLQAIGGGGAVAVATTAAKQLMEAEETNRLLQELVAISAKTSLGLGSVTQGTYAPPKPN